MNSIITAFGQGFTGVIEHLTTGIKTGFSNLLYVDPAAEVKVLSDAAEVGLLLGGVALAVGFVFGVFHFIRKLRG